MERSLFSFGHKKNPATEAAGFIMYLWFKPSNKAFLPAQPSGR